MIYCKTPAEIKLMSEGGEILAEILFQLLQKTKPNISGLELDQLAEKLILEKGAEPGFKKVKDYNYTLCLSVNDIVVHGIPNKYKFKEGDVVGIDCGVYYKGFYTDMAETIKVQPFGFAQGESSKFKVQSSRDEIDRFLETGERALEEAVKMAKIGNRIGHISQTIQLIIEEAGYSVVRSLIGHGVGKKLHEEPEIPGFLSSKINNTPLLREGMTIAIEVIYNMGKSDVIYAQDGWTIKTKDGSISGLFERTVVITKNGPRVLT